MRKVVVNSTPVIALAGIHALHILREMYQEVLIPEAVYLELTAKEDTVSEQLRSADWIHTTSIHNEQDKRMYRTKLHAGEVEVMILAQEISADLVVLDDYAARKTAQYLGLTVTGTIGVIVKAAQKGIIQDAMPLIEALEESGFYISAELKEYVKRAVSI